MKIYYRLSDHGYNKVKPKYITNVYCLINFIGVFEKYIDDIEIIADGVSDDTWKWLQSLNLKLKRTQLGSGAQSFRHVFKKSIELLNNEEIVYFVEDDYVHKPESPKILEDGFKLNADYVTLYDHPDKFINKEMGGNPEVENGGEVTRLLLGKHSHFKLTNSTTMTLAAKVKTLKEDQNIFFSNTSGTYPRDYNIFIELRKKGRSLISSVPGYSTHGETKWMSPFTDWEDEIISSLVYGYGVLNIPVINDYVKEK